MKKSYKLLLSVEIISIIFILFLINISTNIFYIIGFIALELLLLVKYFGIEKKHDKYKRENILNILIVIFSYYFITYLLGLYIGFVQSSYIIKFVYIIKNLFPHLVLIIISEMLRYEYISKGKKNKVIIVLSAIFFILVDVITKIKGYNLTDLQVLITFIASIIVPSITKNVFLTYESYMAGYRANIIYRCLMELPMYILPILPNLGIYVNSSIEVIIPSVIFYLSYELYRNKDKKEKIKSKKTYDIFFYIIVIILLVIMALTSGLFRYHVIAVGSGSMTPNINKGDAVIVKKLSVEEIKNIEVGEILVFKKDGVTIVHRVVQINKITEDKYYFYTKGDNNNSYDGYPISIENVVGVAKGKIRYIGYPTVILNEILESR